jgi:hypothetical protein
VTCIVPPLVVVENDVLELVTVADVELVLRTVCEVVVKVETVVRLVEVLVDSICVDVAVNVPVGELLVVTLVEVVPVTTGLCVEVTVTGGAVVVVLVDELDDAVAVEVWSRVWVEENVAVVVGVVTVTMTCFTCWPTGVAVTWKPRV